MYKHTLVRRKRWLALALAAVLLLTMPTALAQGPDGTAPAGQSPQYWGGWDTTEGGRLQVAVEYHADYPGTGDDLPNAAANAWGFYNYLLGRGWAGRFIWGNQNSWEGDFKKSSLGGWENSYGGYGVDTADLVFYEGHGNPTLFTFDTPWGDGTHTDNYLTYNDARLAWGDYDAEWIALLSCSVLADSHQLDWAWTFNQLHLLLGFKTTAYDVGGFGPRFATYIDNNYHNFNLTSSWFKACDDRQPGGVVAKVMAEEYNHFFDTKDYQYPDWLDNDYFWWTHSCGGRYGAGPNFTSMSAQADITEMPIFKTPPLDLDTEAIPLWNKLGGAFGVPTTTVMVQADGNYFISGQDGRQLEMDVDNGLFTYVDTNSLYTPTAGVAIQAAMDVTQAQTIANTFLQSHGLMPGDALPSEVAQDSITSITQPGRAMGVMGLGPAQVQAITLTNYTVIYERLLSVPIGVQAVPAQFSVVGPGGKLQVNVDPAGLGGARVAGSRPGWRGDWRAGRLAPHQRHHRCPGGSAGSAASDHRSALPEPGVAGSAGPGAVRESNQQVHPDQHVELLGGAVGHRAGSALSGLRALRAVRWHSGLRAGECHRLDLHPGQCQVHAAVRAGGVQLGSRPELCRRASHHGHGGRCLQAAEPAGVHGSAHLHAGSGGTYLYTWYLGSVADANLIGSGRNLTYQFPTSIGLGHDSMSPQTILLKVTDFTSNHTGQNSSTYSISFNVAPPIFLPMVTRAN